MNQALKAYRRPNLSRPSVIIAYAPCINHGIRTGMGTSQAEEKKAVLSAIGTSTVLTRVKNSPFTLDSKKPSISYRDFLMGEVRYSSLTRTFPDRAEELFEKAEKDAAER